MTIIPDQVVQFIEKIMRTWRVELTPGGKSLAKVKIHRGIFLGDAISPLLLVKDMVPLNHIIKLFAQNEKELEALIKKL